MKRTARAVTGLRRSIVWALRVGLTSVRANVLPMVVLWGLALGTVLAYYLLPGTAELFEPIARWQRASGWVAAFLNRFFFCGLLPGVFMLSIARLRPAVRPILVVVTTGLWGGVWGVLTDGFFQLQGWWFGAEPTVYSILMRTLTDQFVWNVLVVTPSVSAFYYWVSCGFSFVRTREAWPRQWVGRVVLPSLLANWCIWIPVVAAVYAFPVPLQIQVSGFASAFWTLVCLRIGGQSVVSAKTRAG